ncbi:hypothetical protein [Sphingomonas aracearum]|uniref:Uncharacterized protein n=1 Tax=Sphingomonas aracearum TaxID=2283317 RepID=A0A369VTG8_9SPHN|nr:hypothetical protein [Sphingomonas aracearum]RDE04945.1 hypothetical protein DVW87_15390 [Sphingomonas aracearum]
MIRNRFLLSLAGAAVLAAPTMAEAATNPAASLSVASSVRASTPAGKKNNVLGGAGIFALIIAAGVIAIPVVAVVSDDDDDSDSN